MILTGAAFYHKYYNSLYATILSLAYLPHWMQSLGEYLSIGAVAVLVKNGNPHQDHGVVIGTL